MKASVILVLLSLSPQMPRTFMCPVLVFLPA